MDFVKHHIMDTSLFTHALQMASSGKRLRAMREESEQGKKKVQKGNTAGAKPGKLGVAAAAHLSGSSSRGHAASPNGTKGAQVLHRALCSAYLNTHSRTRVSVCSILKQFAKAGVCEC